MKVILKMIEKMDKELFIKEMAELNKVFGKMIYYNIPQMNLKMKIRIILLLIINIKTDFLLMKLRLFLLLNIKKNKINKNYK